MNICIKNNSTGQFLNESDTWDLELPGARRFYKTLDALMFCIQKRLLNVCVVVILGETLFQVEIDELKQIYFTDPSPVDSGWLK